MARRGEPDDGGLDWLQSQLGADGEHGDPDESDTPHAPDAPEPAATEEPAWFASLPKRTEPVAPRTAEPPAADADSEAAEPTTARFETAGAQPSSAGASDQGPVTDAAAPASAFSWGLTPTNDPDPRVAPRGQAEPTSLPEPGPAPESPAPESPSAEETPSAAADRRSQPDEEVPTPATSILPVDSVPVARATTEPLAESDTLGPESLTPATGAGRGIRSEADLEPEPWWTTPVQTPLVPTDEERDAGLFPTPMPTTPITSAEHLQPSASVGPAGNDAQEAARRGRRGQSQSAGGAGTGRTDNPKTTRTLIWVAVGLGVVIVLIGLFFLGRQLVGGTPVAAPSPTQTATPTPTPTPPPAPTAPQPAGVHAWDTLFGSECVEPYTSPWDEEFTVVDCATPHTAQLVYRGAFPGDATTAFPGEAALAAQINALCSAPGVIDLAAAGGLPDLQLQGSYPVSEEQWTSGQRNYYCFVSRSSGEPLTASIAGPGPAPAA